MGWDGGDSGEWEAVVGEGSGTLPRRNLHQPVRPKAGPRGQRHAIGSWFCAKRLQNKRASGGATGGGTHTWSF